MPETIRPSASVLSSPTWVFSSAAVSAHLSDRAGRIGADLIDDTAREWLSAEQSVNTVKLVHGSVSEGRISITGGNYARNSGPILKQLWQEWIDRECPKLRDRPTLLDQQAQACIANGRKQQDLLPVGSKPKELDLIEVPKNKTVLNWVGAGGKDKYCTLVQPKFRSAVRWLFFRDRRDDQRLGDLETAWYADDKQPPGPPPPPPPMPAARWMPDLTPPDPPLPTFGSAGRLVTFFIHPSLDTDPLDKPTVRVTLSVGWINGRLPATDKTPEISYVLTVKHLEIQPDHAHASWIKGTLRRPFGTRWDFQRKKGDNEPLLECERLEQVEVLELAPLTFTVFCPRGGFDADAQEVPDGYSEMELRVVERVLEMGKLDPATAEVILARGRLLPPGQSG